jgi:hypothetical protein
MRSRLAIIAMLVFGGLLSTGGGALAVSGFSSQQDNAAATQYGPSGEEDNGDQGVLGEDESGGGGPAGTQDNGGGGEGNGTQPARQVEAGVQATGGEEQLPFTGFAAIPILLGGVALLAAGLALRRRSATE